MTDIQEKLFSLRDEKYAKFSAKLSPTLDPNCIIGVRTPELRKLAKEIGDESFFNDLPHKYFEENQLHAFSISNEKDFAKCISRLEAFLPYIDNWATCDQLSPGVFKKYTIELLPHIEKWMESERAFTVRFGIGMLMRFFLDDNFDPVYLEKIAQIKSDEYYVNMMIAWFFSTALAKQWDSSFPYLEQKKLPQWVHNKTIQKAVESFRVSDEHKASLKKLFT